MASEQHILLLMLLTLICGLQQLPCMNVTGEIKLNTKLVSDESPIYITACSYVECVQECRARLQCQVPGVCPGVSSPPSVPGVELSQTFHAVPDI